MSFDTIGGKFASAGEDVSLRVSSGILSIASSTRLKRSTDISVDPLLFISCDAT